MRNLYQRLSRKNQHKIVDNGKLYPNTTENVIGVLKQNTNWTKIDLGSAMMLWFVIETHKPFDIDNFVNLFKDK